ncbi:hypothetical protein ACROYT_G032477 [Oculina patagonica]
MNFLSNGVTHLSPKAIDCGVLQTPDKAEKVLETHTRVGGVVRFKCKEIGYEISGSEIRTCKNDESWGGLPTSCKIISCGDPGTPDNGEQANVKNGYNYGGSVEFTCKDNYTLSNRSRIYCLATKHWSSPIPRCWAPCPDPGVPGNGSRIGDDFKHGKSVTFSCKDDYELKGDAFISCDDGTWSDDMPQCTAPCPDPGVPGNGSRIRNDFRHGKSVTFKCEDDFELKGMATIRCDYGTWQFVKKVEENGLRLRVYKRYVHDINVIMNTPSSGLRFVDGKVIPDERVAELEKDVEADRRCMFLVQSIGNSIHSSIKLEVDYPSQHRDGKLPILDLKVWVEKKNREVEGEQGRPVSVVLHEFPPDP